LFLKIKTKCKSNVKLLYGVHAFSDERHGKPAHLQKKDDDEEEEEDLNESNYDEVQIGAPVLIMTQEAHFIMH